MKLKRPWEVSIATDAIDPEYEISIKRFETEFAAHAFAENLKALLK